MIILSIDPQTNNDHASAPMQIEPRRSPVDQQEASTKARALSEVSRQPVRADKPVLGGAAGQVAYLPPPAPRGPEGAASSFLREPLLPPKTHVRKLFSDDVLVEDALIPSIPPADPRGEERGPPCIPARSLSLPLLSTPNRQPYKPKLRPAARESLLRGEWVMPTFTFPEGYVHGPHPQFVRPAFPKRALKSHSNGGSLRTLCACV